MDKYPILLIWLKRDIFSASGILLVTEYFPFPFTGSRGVAFGQYSPLSHVAGGKGVASHLHPGDLPWQLTRLPLSTDRAICRGFVCSIACPSTPPTTHFRYQLRPSYWFSPRISSGQLDHNLQTIRFANEIRMPPQLSDHSTSTPQAAKWELEFLSEAKKAIPTLGQLCIQSFYADLSDFQRFFLGHYAPDPSIPEAEKAIVFKGICVQLLHSYANKTKVSAYSLQSAQCDMNDIAKEPMLTVAERKDIGFRELPGTQDYHGLYVCGHQYEKIYIESTRFVRDVYTSEQGVQMAVAKLNTLSTGISPLLTIVKYLATLVSEGSDTACFLLEQFRSTVGSTDNLPEGSKITITLKDTILLDPLHERKPYPEYMCAVMSMIVFALATPANQLQSFIREPILGEENIYLLGGSPILRTLAGLIPSASLGGAYEFAKSSAKSDYKTTLLKVSLYDVTIWKLSSRPQSAHLPQSGQASLFDWMSFDHAFVLGVGPEGVIVFQTWYSYGPKLCDIVDSGGLEVRSWEDGDQLVKNFDKFIADDEVRST